MIQNTAAIFGFEDFWPKVHEQYRRQLEAIGNLIAFANEIIAPAENSADQPVKNVICALTRATMTGASEAIILCGNGCGPGAMKIVRGMYESRWTAEYLSRHSEEAVDYLEFGKITLWRRVKWAQDNRPGLIPAETAKQVEDEFNKVKERFKDLHRWSRKSIAAIAKEIGHNDEYELPYAMVLDSPYELPRAIGAL